MDGDRKRLREIADDRAMPSYARVVALDALSKVGEADDAFVRERYEEMAADPNAGFSPLLAFLEVRGDFSGALAVVEDALKRHDDSPNLQRAYLTTQRAKLLAQMGRLEEAREAIRPALASYREESLLEGASIELALGHGDRALELARAAHERYPRSGEGAAQAARALWVLGDYEGAAREVAGTEALLRPWNRYLPEAFEAAFAALQAAALPSYTLAAVAVQWGRGGAVEPAVRLLEGLHDPAPEWDLKVRTDTYELLKTARGSEEARSWLRSAVPAPSGQAAMSLYQEREYELLLDLFPTDREASWQVRAIQLASLLHLGETGSDRWKALVETIRGDSPTGGFFVEATRVLAGLDPARALFDLLRNMTEVPTLGWVMGVRAASEGRFEEADSWFQVALESGQGREPPHAWSFVIESAWLTTGDSLATLAAAGEF